MEQIWHILTKKSFQKRFFTVLLILYFLVTLKAAQVWFKQDEGLFDFGSFIAAGRFAAAGENPYRYDDPLIYISESRFLNLRVQNPNLNPPISVLLCEFLANFDPLAALRVWQWATLFLYVGCVGLLAFQYPEGRSFQKIVWAFCLTGFWYTLELGQVYVFLSAFCVLAWIFLTRGKNWLAGICIGLVISLKPNFAIWVLFLVAARYYAVALWVAITTGIFGIIPIIAYGPQIYWQWLDAINRYTGYPMPTNYSLNGLLYFLEQPYLVVLLNLFVVGAGLWVVWRKQRKSEVVNALAVTSGLLVSPIAWTGYSLLLLPYFFTRRWTTWMLLSALMMMILLPVLVRLAFWGETWFEFVVFGRWFSWAFLILWGEQIVSK